MEGIPVPLGFNFYPEDFELMILLSLKCNGEPLPIEGLIKEVDLYSLPDPGVLFQGTDSKVVYVFTKLKKVKENGKRTERRILGNRTWKGVDGGKPVYDANRCLIGEKKNFVLMNKLKMKMGFNMTEFSLINSSLKNFVVCKIKKKVKQLKGHKEDIVSTPEICNSHVMTSVPDYCQPQDNSVALCQDHYQYQYHNEGNCPSFVSITPASDGDVMTFVPEGFQPEDFNYGITVDEFDVMISAPECCPPQDNSIALGQDQYHDEANCPSFVSTPANDGDIMISVSEGFQPEDFNYEITVDEFNVMISAPEGVQLEDFNSEIFAEQRVEEGDPLLEILNASWNDIYHFLA